MDSASGVRRPSSIVVRGPLAPFADGLRREAASRGYALDTVGEHVHLLGDLSDWLSARDLTAAALTTPLLDEFLRQRRAAGCRTGLTPRGLAPVLQYLRRIHVAPPEMDAVTATTLLDSVLSTTAVIWWRNEGWRRRRSGTICAVRAGSWTWLPGPLADSLPRLSAEQVVDYVLRWIANRDGAPVDMTTLPALRSLLLFLHATGHVSRSLAAAVPAGRRRPVQVDMPRAARGDHVRAVLAGCDRASAAGRRDYAMLLMLARLAVRGGEVTRLQLADVNWRAGELAIHGKGGRVDVLPLPADFGEAICCTRGPPPRRGRCS